MSQQQYTIAVRNYKDDPSGENITLHGRFTHDTLPEANKVIDLVRDHYVDFLDARVVEIHPATIEAIAHAQHTDLPSTTDRP